jgi:hypothetical protein
MTKIENNTINSTEVKLLSHRKDMLYPKSRCRTALHDSLIIAYHFKDLFINFNLRIIFNKIHSKYKNNFQN